MFQRSNNNQSQVIFFRECDLLFILFLGKKSRLISKKSIEVDRNHVGGTGYPVPLNASIRFYLPVSCVRVQIWNESMYNNALNSSSYLSYNQPENISLVIFFQLKIHYIAKELNQIKLMSF